MAAEYAESNFALNSLFGISFVVTRTAGPRTRGPPSSLNSLFGISFVVT
jgi:hypothetical protein